jgi:hypothetical protein
MVSDQTALYNDNFPVFLNKFGEADVILFGLEKVNHEIRKCIRDLTTLPFHTLNMVSPIDLSESFRVETRLVDWDFHINVRQFDLNLNGKQYKNLRYHVRQSENQGYQIKLSREFTSKHTYILSRHMARHTLDVWDYEELLSLERYFREHDHGLMMEVYQDDKLIGFDFIDFFEDNQIMVVPLGIYLEPYRLSDFMMYQNLKFAQEKGYQWLDIGTVCGSEGLRQFKEKWFAEPKFKLFIQTLHVPDSHPREKS